MKRFLKTTIVTIVIIALICLVQRLDILGFFELKVSEEQIAGYSEYYFNQLEADEKAIYIKMDEAIKNRQTNVYIGIQEDSGLQDKINEVVTAYFYDNPQHYYISNQYTIFTRDFKLFKYSTIQLSYIINTDTEMNLKGKELEKAINNLITDVIKEGMSDFEKEVAIHDALVNHVDYYKYEDINKIPAIKHTAYGALVEKEAVCDGYSKAFKMLLEKVGINSIIISGETDNVAHAWNIVELENEYYHVDVTSDKLEQDNKKHVIHSYFNVTDEQITKTHILAETFKRPQCDFTKYNYYMQKDYYVSSQDNLFNKLNEVILKQKQSNILEVRVDEKYSARRIIDTLYDLNFNNWRYSGKTSVSYNNMEDVYVFIK